MWTRAELKGRAKGTFRLNYWKCVLVALIFAVIGGGAGSSSAIGSSASSGVADVQSDTLFSDNGTDSMSELNAIINGFIDETPFTAQELIIFASIFVVVFMIILIVAAVIDVFVFNPLQIGCNRFFVRNLHEKAQVGNLGFSFDTDYLNAVKIMFFKDLYTILWTLLFVIPGIVKSYEYRLIPYILAENPNMSQAQVFEISRGMMRGNKLKAFVLDLSFIGWHILGAITCGIFEVFYVAPYQYATNAAFYEAVAYGNQSPENQNTENQSTENWNAEN
jgi:uncharacterized membrane protein